MDAKTARVLLGLLDGVEGYISETGYARYWRDEVIRDAKVLAVEADRVIRAAADGTNDSGTTGV